MLHIIVVLLVAVLSFRYGKWRRWKEFLPTIYYLSFFNMFYQYISFTIIKTWELQKHFVNMFTTDLLYTFVAFPCLVVLFISNYLNRDNKVWRYFLKYIIISTLLEWIAVNFGYIKYYNGWNILWTAFFYTSMYPLIIVHYKKPLIALAFSAMIIAFYLTIFLVVVH